MSAIADTHRLSILIELSVKGRLTPSEIRHLTGLSQPAVSHHVKLLIDSELIKAKKEGRNLYLSLNRASLQYLSTFIGELTTTATLGDSAYQRDSVKKRQTV